MSSDEVQQIIDIGYDLAAVKYYSIAVVVVMFYDWLLTLGDEIRFVWSGRKSWVFALYIANRYLPMGYQFWVLAVCFRTNFSQRICDRSAFISILTITLATILAQIVLTLRIYAITRKNRLITACFGVIAGSHLVLGTYFTILTSTKGAQQVLPIPFDFYKVCVLTQTEVFEVGMTSISLLYDLLAFILIIYTASKSNLHQFQIPSLFRIVARDATLYFMVIFTSHLVLEFTLTLGRPSIQLLPAIGNSVYIPVMIGRLMISLKKATTQVDTWSFGEPTLANTGMRFTERGRLTPAGGRIRMDTFSSEHEGTKTQV